MSNWNNDDAWKSGFSGHMNNHTDPHASWVHEQGRLERERQETARRQESERRANEDRARQEAENKARNKAMWGN